MWLQVWELFLVYRILFLPLYIFLRKVFTPGDVVKRERERVCGRSEV